MNSYTITITPDQDGTTTTLHLDTSGDQVVLTDLQLHSSTGLSAGPLPGIDYGLLLRALTAGAPPAGPAVAGAPAEIAAAPSSRRGRTARAAQPAGKKQRRTGRGASATKTAKATPATRKATAKTTSGGSERAYRRMPDDLAAVYQQAGTAASIADHYEVPRHTAQGWLRRLRQQGALPTDR